ncbi:MAG TPA: BTAD domain-containing putative transcriptional regulator [Gemmatimonadaceae bacterium]|nr:BTAD domain-containing putative transcriptional regulator [Gemmatimonadaceae bacterium]
MANIRLLGATAAAERTHDTLGREASPRRLALVALLAIARDAGIDRGRAATLLWHRESELVAREKLDRLVRAVRAELGGDVVIDLGETIRLDTGRMYIDVVDFEEACDAGDLERAAADYEGEFLAGFFLEDAVDFEQWASDQRTRLTARAVAVFDGLAAIAAARGENQRMIDLLRRHADLEPYASAPTLALMRALESCGDAHEALRAGRTYEARIRTFLETDPAVEVLAETRRLRAMVGPAATPANGVPGAGGQALGTAGNREPGPRR